MHSFAYKEIQLSRCLVDEEYQRELAVTRAARMAGAYDDLLLGTPEVSTRPGGRYAVIVGQHRVEMLRQRSVKLVWAKVWTGLTPAEEAYIFDTQPRTERPPSMYQYYKSRLFRSEPVAVDMTRIAACYDFRFACGQGEHNIQAVAACEHIYTGSDKGPDLLEETLSLLSVWSDPSGPSTTIIRGLMAFLRDYSYDRAQLLASLRKVTQGDVLRHAAAKMPSGASLSSWSGSPFVAKEIDRVYHKRRLQHA